MTCHLTTLLSTRSRSLQVNPVICASILVNLFMSGGKLLSATLAEIGLVSIGFVPFFFLIDGLMGTFIRLVRISRH